jgi:predicted nucleotidyltransferase
MGNALSAHQHKRLELAFELSASLSKEEDVMGVYVWGSTAEGRATKMSDLKLVVISKKREDSKHLLSDNVAIKIEYLPLYKIRKELKAGNLLIIDSLRNCIVLYDKYGIMEKLNRKALDFYPENEIDSKFTQAFLEIKDSLDLYNSGDNGGAILASHEAAKMLITSYLYSKGFLRIKSKWILEDLNKIEEKQALEITNLFKDVIGLCDEDSRAKTIMFRVLVLYYRVMNELMNVEDHRENN